jgi:lysine-N-methylase
METSGASPHPGSMEAQADLALKYLSRFSCIGPDCEDNCCHGWKVSVDGRSYQRLIGASRLAAGKEGRRLREALRTEEGPSYAMQLRPDGKCSMLDAGGLCHVQTTFGENFLPDVCATFPRSLHWITDNLEVSATVSCPEVARQLLLHEDAIDVIPFDRATQKRKRPAGGADPRDIRPYWRLMLEVRSFVLELLRRTHEPIEKRLFWMTWFAKRTAELLDRKVMKGDLELARREIRLLREETVREEIGRRFDALSAPAALGLQFARVLAQESGGLRQLVAEVFQSYAGPRGYLEEDALWAEYQRRRASLDARAGKRIEQFLTNASFNYWMHHLVMEAPDLLTYTLRMLAQLAFEKFLLYSHPRSAEHLDEVAVEVFYRSARHIEHSSILNRLEELLEKNRLRSFAGAFFLVRF